MTMPIASDTLPAGKHWSMILWRNNRLRLTDLEGGANVGMLFFNPLNLLERYNAPDTLKCQHSFKLTEGHCLYSDMGRIFCSIVVDDFGWHESVCGSTTKVSTSRKWGERDYQRDRNDWLQNGYDSFLIEAAKYGLGRRDLPANVNWFSKVVVADDGALSLDMSAARQGASVELRFEKMEHFNSSTIAALVQLIRVARSKEIKVAIVYDASLKWQKASFGVLQILAEDIKFDLRSV